MSRVEIKEEIKSKIEKLNDDLGVIYVVGLCYSGVSSEVKAINAYMRSKKMFKHEIIIDLKTFQNKTVEDLGDMIINHIFIQLKKKDIFKDRNDYMSLLGDIKTCLRESEDTFLIVIDDFQELRYPTDSDRDIRKGLLDLASLENVKFLIGSHTFQFLSEKVEYIKLEFKEKSTNLHIKNIVDNSLLVSKIIKYFKNKKVLCEDGLFDLEVLDNLGVEGRIKIFSGDDMFPGDKLGTPCFSFAFIYLFTYFTCFQFTDGHLKDILEIINKILKGSENFKQKFLQKKDHDINELLHDPDSSR